MNRLVITGLAGCALALAPFTAAASNDDDWQVFARCADAMHPVAVIDIRVKGMSYHPLPGGGGATAHFNAKTSELVLLDADGSEVATVTQDAKTVTIRGGWASYAGHDVDSARIFRTLDPACAPDQRTITFKKPVIPAD
ncbi:MAG TPA: hypothetical protein VHS78_06350 [Candidatus Elarobacter sp.]|jgi:hypothetical protein|nr:hypothetical protein [Candidatus Elarobacter sp.]